MLWLRDTLKIELCARAASTSSGVSRWDDAKYVCEVGGLGGGGGTDDMRTLPFKQKDGS